MDFRIADLKIGAELVFGSYGVGPVAHPITWLKANNDGEFLSKFVLDLLKFDEAERNNPIWSLRYKGNGDYETSNILQFMNSYEDDWYAPMHDYDSPPGNVRNEIDIIGQYVRHPGFLNGFEDYEIECLVGRIDLPSIANIYGAGGIPRFALFNRKGFRGRPSADLVYGKFGHDMNKSSFCEFWLADKDMGDTCKAAYVARSGYKRYISASCWCGFRPKCVINADTKVEPSPDGHGFRIVPFEATKRRDSKVCTDEEFMALMGLL